MKLRLPPLPGRIDKEKLFKIYSPKLYFEQKSVRSGKKLKETLESPDTNKYVKATAQVCADGDRKDLQEFLESENAEYKRRFKVTIAEDEKKAMDGQNRSLFRLIAWDKKWLRKDWVQQKILIADIDDNRTFFEQLADALKSRKGRRRTLYPDLVDYFKRMRATGANFNNRKHVKAVWEWLGGFIEDNRYDICNIKMFQDKSLFHKFLRDNELK